MDRKKKEFLCFKNIWYKNLQKTTMADKLVKCEAAWEKFFEKADVNSDGSVSIEELKHILTVEYNQKLSDREIAVSLLINLSSQTNFFLMNKYGNLRIRYYKRSCFRCRDINSLFEIQHMFSKKCIFILFKTLKV